MIKTSLCSTLGKCAAQQSTFSGDRDWNSIFLLSDVAINEDDDITPVIFAADNHHLWIRA